MSDTVDHAQQIEQAYRQDAIAAASRKQFMPFVGECYNCREPISQGCFCDGDCRDDFERRVKLKGWHAGSN